MKKRIFLYLLFLIAYVTPLASQTSMVEGKVFDEKDKTEYTAFQVRNLSLNTKAKYNLLGSFRIEANIGDTLQVNAGDYYKKQIWVVDSLYHDFYLQKEVRKYCIIGESLTLFDNYFFASFQYSFKDKLAGANLGYTESLYRLFSKSPRWFSKMNLNGTYVFSKFNGHKKDNLFLMQLLYPQNIPLNIKNFQPIEISVGAGYYWVVKDSYKFYSGNMMFSTDIQFLKKSFHGKRPFSFALYCGYNWFVNKSDSDFLSIGIRFFPFYKRKMFAQYKYTR